MRTFRFVNRSQDDLTVMPNRDIILNQINNKLFLVRSFIDQKITELNARAKNDNDLNIMAMIREIRWIDEDWQEWKEKTMADFNDLAVDPEVLKYRVHHEMNDMLDRMEQYDN